jgi:tRNA threonylcarbamoyladenosine biosynthesis protein TsaE
MSVVLGSHEAMLDAGRKLGALLRPGDAVALIGPLGAGKTTLSQGIAEGAGVQGEVSSPTFALMNVYEGRLPVFHLDLYRIEDPHRLNLLGYDDALAETGATLAEWADKHWPFWTDDVLTVRINLTEGGRELHVETGGPRSTELERLWLSSE